MINCHGSPLDSDNSDNVIPRLKSQLKKKCCWVYAINWNGRIVDDIICSSRNDDVCEIEIKIIKSTIEQRCTKYGLTQATDELKKPGANLSRMNS